MPDEQPRDYDDRDELDRRGRRHGILSNGDERFIRKIVADENRRRDIKIMTTFFLAFGALILTIIWQARGVVAKVDTNTDQISDIRSGRVDAKDLQLRDFRIQSLSEAAAHNSKLLLEISRNVAELSNNVSVLSAQVGRDRLVQ